jgi:glycosyltransferase involved in cell wall biosynthesis
MIPEFETRRFGRPWNPHFRKKAYLKTSDAVLSISDSTTIDMRRRYGFTFPVQTTHLGVSSEFSPGIPRIPSLPSKYFLYVGNRGGYKNAGVAIEAFARVSSTNENLFLVFCGGGTLSRVERKAMRMLGIESKVLHFAATSSELPGVYSNAEALLYPTRIEGFGLPLVEAMASGIPVLASSTAINHEVAGSAASYFPREDPLELASLMQAVLIGETQFQERIGIGLERAKEFSWYRCAELTAKIYRDVALRERRPH